VLEVEEGESAQELECTVGKDSAPEMEGTGLALVTVPVLVLGEVLVVVEEVVHVDVVVKEHVDEVVVVHGVGAVMNIWECSVGRHKGLCLDHKLGGHSL